MITLPYVKHFSWSISVILCKVCYILFITLTNIILGLLYLETFSISLVFIIPYKNTKILITFFRTPALFRTTGTALFGGRFWLQEIGHIHRNCHIPSGIYPLQWRRGLGRWESEMHHLPGGREIGRSAARSFQDLLEPLLFGDGICRRVDDQGGCWCGVVSVLGVGVCVGGVVFGVVVGASRSAPSLAGSGSEG